MKNHLFIYNKLIGPKEISLIDILHILNREQSNGMLAQAAGVIFHLNKICLDDKSDYYKVQVNYPDSNDIGVENYKTLIE